MPRRKLLWRRLARRSSISILAGDSCRRIVRSMMLIPAYRLHRLAGSRKRLRQRPLALVEDRASIPRLERRPRATRCEGPRRESSRPWRKCLGVNLSVSRCRARLFLWPLAPPYCLLADAFLGPPARLAPRFDLGHGNARRFSVVATP